MTLSNARARFELVATATPIGTNVQGDQTVGVPITSLSVADAETIYSVRAILAGSPSAFVLAINAGTTSGSTAWTAGAAQVETNTVVAAGGCTSNGTMTLVVTAAGMTGSPKNVAVDLTTTAHTTAALIAAAARTALAADSAVAAMFTIGGSGANITLTRLPTNTFTVPGGTLNLYAANDGTLNLNIPSGLGVTASATSTNTTAGVLTAGAKVYDGDGNDFEGVAIPTLTAINAIMTECDESGSSLSMAYSLLSGAVGNATTIREGVIFQIWSETTGAPMGDLTLTSGGGVADFTITVLGS